MALKKTKKEFKTQLRDFSEVVNDFTLYFEGKGYKVDSEVGATSTFISITKGGVFKTVSGMKTGLNINLTPYDGYVEVSMGVGIFGKQLVPSIITALVFWPFIITQVIGIIKQNKLDDEAYSVIEESIRNHEPNGRVAREIDNNSNGKVFCPHCGQLIEEDAKFCPHCGQATTNEKECPECGAKIDANTKFCPQCGHKF